jgi:hypothetical protein
MNGGKFEVKGEGEYSVHFKNVIVIGPLPDKSIADSIAIEYNYITEKRKAAIQIAIDKAEKEINDVCCGVIDNVTHIIRNPEANKINPCD